MYSLLSSWVSISKINGVFPATFEPFWQTYRYARSVESAVPKTMFVGSTGKLAIGVPPVNALSFTGIHPSLLTLPATPVTIYNQSLQKQW